METGNFIRKLEQFQSKDMVHYALFNSTVATLAGLGFVVFFHLVKGGGGAIINDPSEYAFGCAGIFAGSAIGSCFGWKMKADPDQEGGANGKV